jgi:hypothetical protein
MIGCAILPLVNITTKNAGASSKTSSWAKLTITTIWVKRSFILKHHCDRKVFGCILRNEPGKGSTQNPHQDHILAGQRASDFLLQTLVKL